MRIKSSFLTVTSADTVRILLQNEIAVHKKGKKPPVASFRVEGGAGETKGKEVRRFKRFLMMDGRKQKSLDAQI